MPHDLSESGLSSKDAVSDHTNHHKLLIHYTRNYGDIVLGDTFHIMY